MRKHQQKQILELIRTLHEAHAEIKRLFSRQNAASVMQLLADSQEFVIEIGTYIENIEGEGTRTVALLEECHEALYQISVELSNDANHDGALITRFGEQLIKVEDSVRNELKPNKIEVVFLPYKASMFDALESIWLAAKDDPHCDAFVIPIPYFDRLPDGALGNMHYEGDQYPDDVPVVDFRTYDIEARRPDMIFIHNPYDGGNRVTSVHPDYYSERLKNYTDLLAYVPYFVVSDNVQEHFCTCAGVLHADKVFVQSEKVRDTYVRALKEFETKHNCEGRFGHVESKIVASGSPKFDKAIASKPEDFTVPAEWRSIMERPDGTRRKIVLYNTSIGAILQGNEQYIKKLRFVLDTFRTRDDVLLWWRPHPLNEATYETMRPQLLNEYEQIMADYRREGWGIYDDTADLHRSISLSSMYFGDRSSLVALYQCTGKPVVIQDTSLTGYDRETAGLIFECIVEDDRCLWLVSATYNALFKMDRSSWRAEYMGEFPNERLGVLRLYRGIAKCGDKLFFAPFAAKEAAVFDISTRRFDKIAFRHFESELVTANPFLFYHAVSYGRFVYFLPFRYPGIVRLDTESGDLTYYTDWLNDIEEATKNPVSRGFFYNYCINGNELILPCAHANAVILFNMDNGTSKLHILGENSNRYFCACFDGMNYWLCTIAGSVFRWNQTNHILTEVVAASTNDDSPKAVYGDMFYSNGCVWVFPSNGDAVVKIDVSDNSVEKADIFNREIARTESGAAFFNWKFVMSVPADAKIYAHTGKSKHLIEYSTITGEKREEAIIPDEKTLAALRTHYYANNFIGAGTAGDCNYIETPNLHFGISEFLDFFTQPDLSGNVEKVGKKQLELRNNEISNADAGAGQNIYQSCKAAALGK